MQNPKGSLGPTARGDKTLTRKKQGTLWQQLRLTETERPALYSVMLLNDNATPMDFVVELIREHFHTSMDEAVNLMLQIHNDGEGTCGTYTREVAETKVAEVIECARQFNHPLKCLMKKAKK